MKKIINLVIAVVSLASMLAGSAPAYATTTTTPNIVITAFGGSNLLDFAELYNQSTAPINLADYQLQFSIHDAAANGCGDQTYTIAASDGWLLPQSYFTFERVIGTGLDANEAFYNVSSSFLTGCQSPQLSGVRLSDSGAVVMQNVTFTPGLLTATNWAEQKQRTNPPLKITGNFTSDYSLINNGAPNLFSTLLYQPPADTSGLQIVELLPHAATCGPLDSDPSCIDYVKLFNSSQFTVNLADYRLRTSYGGQKSTSRNTLSLSGSLEPGKYLTIDQKDDGTPLSLTQSGGNVWLEDAAGVQPYQPVIEYPDASSTSKIGQTWAFNGQNWQWTSSPQPTGPNDFPLPISEAPPVSSSSATSSYKPCLANQVRNPETHRCRKITSSTKTLAACKPGQTRNLATNRCRSLATLLKKRAACKPGQTRNPVTNRCRSVLAATKSRKPCKPGQERNPDTGRCRKAQPKLTPIHDIRAAAKTSGNRWYLLAVIAAGAAAYLLYEWHQEFAVGLGRFKAKVKLQRGQKTANLVK